MSTHYYVLSLSEKRTALFEAFRGSLIDVENRGFPVLGDAGSRGSIPPEGRLELARTVDRCFGQYHANEPLKLVIVGESAMLTAFLAVTVHEDAVIGQIEGDREASGIADLGQMVWLLVKGAMSGALDGAMHDLHDLTERGSVVSGLEPVARAVDGHARSTLLVEEGYHLRGSIAEMPRPLTIRPEVDVRSTLDDVVDLVIDRVLDAGGDVIFTPPGGLVDWKQIVLLPRVDHDRTRNQTKKPPAERM